MCARLLAGVVVAAGADSRRHCLFHYCRVGHRTVGLYASILHRRDHERLCRRPGQGMISAAPTAPMALLIGLPLVKMNRLET